MAGNLKEWLFGKAKRFWLELVKPPTVFDVVVIDNNEECVTYNAKVSVTNPHITPIRISKFSYTLKTAQYCREVVSGTIEMDEELPRNDKKVLHVPMKVPQSHMKNLLKEKNGEAWNSNYKLDMNATFDLPLCAGHVVPLSPWEGEIRMDL